MWQVSPVQLNDLQQLHPLVVASNCRTLSYDIDLLRQQVSTCIEHQQQTIHANSKFIWLLKDEQQQIQGFCTVKARAGGNEPFYNFSQDQLIHHSQQLKQNQRINVLYLSHHLSGLIHLGDFYVKPSVPAHAASLLMLIRIVWLVEHQNELAEDVICELTGVEAQLFWQEVGEPFFQCPMRQANQLLHLHGKSIIAELLPFHPIYQPLLSPECQISIGIVGKSAIKQRNMLEQLGFWQTRFVDIFDAGPVFRQKVQHLAKLLTQWRQQAEPNICILHTNNGLVLQTWHEPIIHQHSNGEHTKSSLLRWPL